MALGCKGICINFLCHVSGKGRFTYKNNIIFCRSCECGYKFISHFCPCCGHRVRQHTWQGPNRKAASKTIVRY